MAGFVKVNLLNKMYGSPTIEARDCPAVHPGRWPYPQCLIPQGDGYVSACPFLQAVDLRYPARWSRQPSLVDTIDTIVGCDIKPSDVRVVCLRKESKGVEAGAHENP